MSVYKPKNSPYWHYDFVVKGERFHGSTGSESKRAAEDCERRLRNERARLGASGIQQQLDTAAPEMTVDVAVESWWVNVGERLDSAADRERQLLLWIKLLGPTKRMVTIRETDIAKAIRKRRAIPYRKKLPSDTTINRFVAALRAVWRYLDSDENPLPRIKWGKFTTEETVEHPPEISDRQLDALDAAADARADKQRKKRRNARTADWVQLMAEIVYSYGLRAGEVYFHPDWFDPAEHKISVPKKRRKKDVTLTITLLPEHTQAIAARWSRAKAAGLPHIWFDEFGGKLVPVSRNRGDYQMREALKAAGLGTKIHRLRHRVGTELLRSTEGNLKLVKEALGHASLQSTIRYARVSEEDLRAGFAAISRNSPERLARSKKKSEG